MSLFTIEYMSSVMSISGQMFSVGTGVSSVAFGSVKVTLSELTYAPSTPPKITFVCRFMREMTIVYKTRHRKAMVMIQSVFFLIYICAHPFMY